MYVETDAGAGKRHRAQRRAAKAGGWQVWAPSRWTTPCNGIGGGERVWKRGVVMTKDY